MATKHTCGGPVFGRRTAGCPRCDELTAGARPVKLGDTTASAPEVAWPEGVIARYLTDAGKAIGDPTVTVDLIETNDRITGHCAACPSAMRDFHFDPACTGDRMEGFVIRQATAWAQAHAEVCRAMPKPGGEVR